MKIKEYQMLTVEPKRLSSLDLKSEALTDHWGVECVTTFVIPEDKEFLKVGPEVIFFPDTDRAGIAWGADAVWTDATSVEDAIERFFELNGKEIIP